MSYKEKFTKPDALNEPMVAYVTVSSFNPFYNLLGGSNLNDLDIVKLARQGFSKRVLEIWKELFSQEDPVRVYIR